MTIGPAVGGDQEGDRPGPQPLVGFAGRLKSSAIAGDGFPTRPERLCTPPARSRARPGRVITHPDRFHIAPNGFPIVAEPVQRGAQGRFGLEDALIVHAEGQLLREQA